MHALTTDGKPFRHEMKITCFVHGTRIDNAMLYYDKQWFILQDNHSGYEPDSEWRKYGYRYSWRIGDGSPDKLIKEFVSEIRKYNTNYLSKDDIQLCLD